MISVLRRAGRPMRALLLVAASAALSGCFLWTTRGEGNDLEEQGDDHERRLDALESGLREDRERLQSELTDAQAKMAELRDVLEKATQVVKRNSADMGLEVQRLRDDLGRIEGSIEEIRNAQQENSKILAQFRTDIDARLTKSTGQVQLTPEQIPADRTEHFSAAYRAYQAAEYPMARALFAEYITRYARDDQADNARYWMGASYLEQQQPARALGEFRRVVSDYPDGDALDETLLAMADAFFQLHACTDARAALDALIRGHADSPLVRRARTKLREIERAPRSACTS